MANRDWDPDDLLDFKYDHEVPKRPDNDFEILDRLSDSRPKETGRGLQEDPVDYYDELKLYESMRHRSEPPAPSYDAPKRAQAGSHDRTSGAQREASGSARRSAPGDASRQAPGGAPRQAGRQAPREAPSIEQPLGDRFLAQFGRNEAGQEKKKPVELPDERRIRPPKDLGAIKQASQDAYERYRSNYVKNRTKMAGRIQLNKAMKILTGAYGITLAAFLLSMTVMNVLPGGMLIALYVVLGLLTAVIYFQMRRRSVKVWARRMATVLAVFLIFIYGMGTAYALGTLSFLSSTSVDNDSAVANITKDPFNVVITGMDVTGKIDTQGRSDVNMIVTVNPKTGQILMTSIPRDYQIYMPDKDMAVDKLTHTGFYSVESTILAEENLLDIVANYYVKVNFTTVEKFIDAIGGVDVYSEVEFTPSYNAYPDDRDAPPEVEGWTVKEGVNHMTGAQALVFARERKAFDDGDRTRIKHQQAVFEAMIKKATSSKTMLLSYNKILSNLKAYFEMSFSSKELRALVKYQLAKNPNWKIYRNTITGGDGSMILYSTGDAYAYVMTQDEESIGNAKTLIQAVMEGQELDKDEDGNVYVVQTDEGTEDTQE